MFGAWNRNPGQWEAVLSKNRSADLFLRFVGISSPRRGGGVASSTCVSGVDAILIMILILILTVYGGHHFKGSVSAPGIFFDPCPTVTF